MSDHINIPEAPCAKMDLNSAAAMNADIPAFAIAEIDGGVFECVVNLRGEDASFPLAGWLEGFFGEEEFRVSRSFKLPKRRAEWMGGRACAKRLAASLLGVAPKKIVVESDVNGCPFLVGIPSLKISISHSASLAACAASLVGNIGIDIEQISGKRDWQKNADKKFSSYEKAKIIDERCFYENWTIKEAFWKYLGDKKVVFGDIEIAEEAIYLHGQRQNDVAFFARAIAHGEYMKALVYPKPAALSHLLN